MIKREYHRVKKWVEKNRFLLLLLATLLVLVLPAFSGSGFLSEILFWISLTFLFLQSMIAGDVRKSGRNFLRITGVLIIILTWLRPAGFESVILDVIRLALFAIFFLLIIHNLFRFILNASKVNMNVLITSINIYLLIGIIAASLSSLLFILYPEAYNFPDHITDPQFLHFVYFCFITMSTLGYGDIVPMIPETQTLSYLIAITGQLYVAIIIAFLVGKFLVHSDKT